MYIYLLLLSVVSAERFAVIGDYGKDSRGELEVANLIKTWDANQNLTGILTLGDNNYDVGSSSTIEKNIGKYYGSFLKIFYPSPGNHDWGTGTLSPYLNYFNVTRYYNKTFTNVEIFMLDSDNHEPDGITVMSKQALWLKNALNISKMEWKIVLFHHPPYSSGEHGNSVNMQWPFYDWGANMVISGHDHNYERLVIRGNTYIVNGLGGAEIREFKKIVTGSKKRYNKNYGALLLDVSIDKLKIKFISIDNKVQDYITLTK